MHVNRRGDAVLPQRLADQRADGQVGHVVVVHDVEMHDVGAGGEHVVDFLAEFGEVGGKNAGGDPEGPGHGVLPKVNEKILPAAACGGLRICDGAHKRG